MHMPSLIPVLIILGLAFMILTRPGISEALFQHRRSTNTRTILFEALGWIAFLVALVVLPWVLSRVGA